MKNKNLLFKEIANEKKIKINSIITDSIYIKIDPFAVDRILNNIIDNAINYSQKKGIIDVSLKSDTGINTRIYNRKNLIDNEFLILDNYIEDLLYDLKTGRKSISNYLRYMQEFIYLSLASKKEITKKINQIARDDDAYLAKVSRLFGNVYFPLTLIKDQSIDEPINGMLLEKIALKNIENFIELRKELTQEGHVFKSETDTEVIPHLIENKLHEGLNLKDSIIISII